MPMLFEREEKWKIVAITGHNFTENIQQQQQPHTRKHTKENPDN